MANSNKSAAWLALGHKLLNVCEGILQQTNFAQEDKHASNQKIVALTLMCRSANNFAGARLLVENGFIVEARALVRCCLENFFWIGGLTAKGDDFIKEVILDDAANRLKSGANLLQWAKKRPEEVDFERKLDAFIAKLKVENPRPSTIRHKNVTDAAEIGDAYIIYSELSRDAAHPSATSLSRHLIEDPLGVADLTLSGKPLVDPEEEVQTIEFGCLALLGVCVGTNDLVGGTEPGKQLAELCEDYKALMSHRG